MRLRRWIRTGGKKLSKNCDSRRYARGEQQEVKGGEVQASQIRHAESRILVSTIYGSSLPKKAPSIYSDHNTMIAINRIGHS